MKRCAKYKYLGEEITNEGTWETATKERNLLEKKLITVLNGKRNMHSVIKSIITYSCEMWPIKETTNVRRCRDRFLEKSRGKVKTRTSNKWANQRSYASNAYNGWNKEQTTHVVRTCAKDARNSDYKTSYKLETSRKEKTSTKLAERHRQNNAVKGLGRYVERQARMGETGIARRVTLRTDYIVIIIFKRKSCVTLGPLPVLDYFVLERVFPRNAWASCTKNVFASRTFSVLRFFLSWI